MSKQFDLSHIEQLINIQDARRRDGQSGIGAEVEGLIRRLTSGGVASKTDDVRTEQVKWLWRLGVGRELGLPSFEDYFADIPEIPEDLVKDDAHFQLLVLVEPRIALNRLCELGNIKFRWQDNRFVEYDKRHREFDVPAWIRVGDGRKNWSGSFSRCRRSSVNDDLGLTVFQGVCAYLQHPEPLANDRVIKLPGSVHQNDIVHGVFLEVCRSQAWLDLTFANDVYPELVTRECVRRREAFR